jgi:hypothetical protein
MCLKTIAHSIRHHISSSILFKRLAIEPLALVTIPHMPFTRAPRNILSCWFDNLKPLGWRQINWGRALKTGSFRVYYLSSLLRESLE